MKRILIFLLAILLSIPAAANPFGFGMVLPGAGNHTGSIDEIQIHNRVLTETQIQTRYDMAPHYPLNQAKTPKTASDQITGKINTPYTFTFQTHMVRNGARIRLVQELLGHEQINTMQIYTYLTPLDLKQAFHKSHPRGKTKIKIDTKKLNR